MTVIIGIKCGDGAVIGADSAATFGTPSFRTITQPTMKIDIVGDAAIVAGTGYVGSAQRFHATVDNMWREKKFVDKDHATVAAMMARAHREDIARSAGIHPGTGMALQGFGALVAFPAQSRSWVYQFEPDSFQPERLDEKLWYASMGCGMAIADPVLAIIREALWDDGPPDVSDAVFAVAWVLAHVIRVNPGGVGFEPRIAVLEHGRKGACAARLLPGEEVMAHTESVKAFYAHMRKFRDRFQPDSPGVESPPVPAPRD